MTAIEIQALCNRVIAQRDFIGVLGVVHQHVYEGEDGKFVCAGLTDYETYLVDCELGGESLADENIKARADWRRNGD